MMKSVSHYPSNTENTGDSIKCHSKSAKEQKAHSFNHIEKLAADHDVSVSSTMIKITYHKGIKDHSDTFLHGHKIGDKQHSITYKQSFSDSFSNKLPSIHVKNCRKSFNNIVFVPNHLHSEDGKKASLENSIKDVAQAKYQRIISRDKHCIKSDKSSFNNDIYSIKCNRLNNQMLDSQKYSEKGLQVPQKILNGMGSEKPNVPVPVNNVTEETQSHKSSNVSEVESKTKNNTLKNLTECKKTDLIDNSTKMEEKTKKDTVKPEDSNNVEKEKLKSQKIKVKNLKRKRPGPAGADVAGPTPKKIKKLPNISQTTQKKDKVNTSKVKVNDKKQPNNGKERTISKTVTDKQNLEAQRRELLHDDPSLPAGWHRLIKGKHTGEEFKPVVCISSPEGKKFYFKAKLREYLEKTNSSLTIDDFYFGLYKKRLKKVDKEKETPVKKIEKPRKISLNGKGNETPETGRKRKERKSSLGAETNLKRGSSSANAVTPKGTSQGVAAVDKNSSLRLQENMSHSDIGKKRVLMCDPDLPPGWVRKVRKTKGGENSDKYQVWLVSPEGKRFRRKYLLQQYLLKNRSPLDINRFHFGLYPRKDASKGLSPHSETKKGPTPTVVNRGNRIPKKKLKAEKVKVESLKKRGRRSKAADALNNSKSDKYSSALGDRKMTLILTKMSNGGQSPGSRPLLDDPTLPPGWRRQIKVRSTGESAGRMEVVIISPDGKKHGSRGSLESYIAQKGLNLKADEFDFSLSGKNSINRRNSSSSAVTTPKPQNGRKRRNSSTPLGTPFANLSLPSSRSSGDAGKTREALMIDYVTGLTLNCGLRDVRSERRLRIPREEHEKHLKKYLDSDKAQMVNSEKDISGIWVQTLVNCRSDFGALDADAADTIAAMTKDFLQGLARRAWENSRTESSLEYRDVAEVVDKSESLSPLKALIPKTITFREFVRLNQPKKMSFT